MYKVIPDERHLIEQTLIELCDKEGCSFVVTTGGTGPAPRDVTPEATEAVCFLFPMLLHAMHNTSFLREEFMLSFYNR